MQNDFMNNLINLGAGFEHVMLQRDHLAQLPEHRCSICRDEFDIDMLITRTPCGHIMHYHCLVPCFFDGKC